MSEAAFYLLDVNTAIALLDESHQDHETAAMWLNEPERQWALCAFTESGVLRFFASPATGDYSIREAAAMLEELTTRSGYRYQPIRSSWGEATKPLAKRLHGYRQITDAFLLGVAIREGMVLATFDQAMLHLAGEHRRHVHLLGASGANGKVA